MVKAAAFLSFDGLAHDQVSDVNHIAQFANIARGDGTLKKTFRFFL
jgi:hypothetical protein